MSIPPDMAERHARVLARLTELGLALAEQQFADAQAAETPAERIEAVKAFHTISRSVRQTVALEAKLARQQSADALEASWVAAVAPRRRPSLHEQRGRVQAVRNAVTRVIWHETEDDDSAIFLGRTLQEELVQACEDGDICAEALDDQVMRICLDLGLSEDAARNWRDLPDLPPDDPDETDPPDAPPPGMNGREPQPQSSA